MMIYNEILYRKLPFLVSKTTPIPDCMCRGRERDRHESVSESENLVDTRVTETHISRP